LNGVPKSFTGCCRVVINDVDFDVVARNAIMLLVAFQFEPKKAADIMLHVWYSALLPREMIGSLQSSIKPLVQDICNKIKNKPEASLQAKTWKKDTRSLRLVLEKSQWDKLLSYFEVPHGLTAVQAQDIRRSITLADDRKDYVERALLMKTPGQRVSIIQFRKDGLLLPFGAPRQKFDTPNP
jgi:hypothetical protein